MRNTSGGIVGTSLGCGTTGVDASKNPSSSAHYPLRSLVFVPGVQNVCLRGFGALCASGAQCHSCTGTAPIICTIFVDSALLRTRTGTHSTPGLPPEAISTHTTFMRTESRRADSRRVGSRVCRLPRVRPGDSGELAAQYSCGCTSGGDSRQVHTPAVDRHPPRL